jgi:hypothetical protein
MSRRLAVILWLVAASVLDARQQKHKIADEWPEQVSPAGLVVGRVVDATTNRPVGGAVVTLTAAMPGVEATRVAADGEGRFLFRGLAAGRYVFAASAPSYLDGGFGQQRPGGTTQPFTLADSQRVGDVTLRLWKAATIAGTVVDESGHAVEEVTVTLLRRATAGGGARAAEAGQIRDAQTARTDDRGSYRFGGLAPGTYYVSVGSRTIQNPPAGAPAIRLADVVIQTGGDGMWGNANVLAGRLPASLRADGRITGYVPTFHPEATSIAGATALLLNAGDDRAAVDVRLRSVTMARVSGNVVGPNGPEAGIDVALIPTFAANQPIERTHGTVSGRADATGAFTFVAVPPGQYVLRAWRRPQILVIGRDPLPEDASLWREETITIGDTPVNGLTVNVQRGVILSGRLRFEGAAAPPNPVQLQTTLSVAFEPPWFLAFGARMATRVSATFDFVTQGLPPGRYFPMLPNTFTASARGWHFESVRHDGKDLMIEPLMLEGRPINGVEIVFSDRPSEIAGTILDATGRAAADAAVVVFPANYQTWVQHGRSRLAAPAEMATQRGTFQMAVRPGDYLVAAVGEDVFATWPETASIDAIAARATKVTVVRGDKKIVELRR